MSRLAARRAAMQLSYEHLLGGEGGNATLQEMIDFDTSDAEDKVYIDCVLQGIASHELELDEQIQKLSPTRGLERIPLVVRAILRLALFEMQHLKDAPNSVVINEAVELAKRFGEESDARFVNGVLGSVAREMTEP